MRDDKWLFQKLDEVWDNHFNDIPQDNDVKIIWGKRARGRLGSIKLGISNQGPVTRGKNHPVTIITINSLFKDPVIPEYVVLGTIAHELVHYAHGFNSPLEQRYKTPHAGGIIHKELRDRGLEEVHKLQKKWIRECWRDYIMQNFPPKTKKRVIIRWI